MTIAVGTSINENGSDHVVKMCARRKDGAKDPSLLDHFGHFDVPIFDAKAQVFDP